MAPPKPPTKSMGSSTKYTPTGDLKQTISRLQSSLSSIHYPKSLNVAELIQGSPLSYLPILDWILFGFSRSVAKLLCEHHDAAEMRHRSDLRFTEHCWRIFNEAFAWSPALKVTQFLTESGFVERKALLIVQLVDLVKRRHNDLVRQKKKAKKRSSSRGRCATNAGARSRSNTPRASSAQPVYGTEVMGTKRQPQQYFAEKAHQYEGQAEEVDEWIEEVRERQEGGSGSATTIINTTERPPNVRVQRADSTSSDAPHTSPQGESTLPRTMPAPSAPEKSEESNEEEDNLLTSQSPVRGGTAQRNRFPISTDDEPSSPLPTAPPAGDEVPAFNGQEKRVPASEEAATSKRDSYENASAPPAQQQAQQNGSSPDSSTGVTTTSAASDAILNLIDFKFQQFEKKLEQVCHSLDGRMAMLEGKMNFLQDRIEEDRKSSVRIRTTGFGVSDASGGQRRTSSGSGSHTSSPVRRASPPRRPRQQPVSPMRTTDLEEPSVTASARAGSGSSSPRDANTTRQPQSDVQISTLGRESNERKSKIDMSAYVPPSQLEIRPGQDVSFASGEDSSSIGQDFGIPPQTASLLIQRGTTEPARSADLEGITSDTSNFIHAMRNNITSTEQLMENLGISRSRNALERHSVLT
uniref:Centrosomal protein of 44 kDa n=1 Tax=Percolomonas cosmopolitus TaxID=63605 RepID=A0A7S1PHG3_9EUKA